MIDVYGNHSVLRSRWLLGTARKRVISMPSSNPPPSSRSERLESLEALRDLKSRYARLADLALGSPSAANAANLADLFTNDAFADYGFFGTFTGRAALLNAFENVLPGGTRWSAHYIVNPLLTVNGDNAEGTWSFLIHAVPRNPPNAAQVTFFGKYAEKYRRQNGVWKISELVVSYSAP